jgi:hypothetical protein
LDIRAKVLDGEISQESFPFDAISPPVENRATSRLTILKIGHLSLTRNGFSSLLRMCPALKRLSMNDVALLTTPCFEPYQHMGLMELDAPIDQVFIPDTGLFGGPSILAHFPRLQVFNTRLTERLPHVPYGDMRDQIKRFCPFLEGVGIDAPEIVSTSLLNDTFQTLTCITVKKLSSNVILAILAHQRTLESLSTVRLQDCDQEQFLQLRVEQPSVPEQELQLIPHRCARLTTLALPQFEMGIEEVEKAGWSCTDLNDLYIRIRELNTRTKIDRAIKFWVYWRVFEHPSSAPIGAISYGNSIEERVARYLARFQRLQKVWLGHKIVQTPSLQ